MKRPVLLLCAVAAAAVPTMFTSSAAQAAQQQGTNKQQGANKQEGVNKQKNTRGTEANEKKVSLDKIPAKAREALLKEANGAKILSVEQGQKEGKTFYEGSFRQGNDVVGVSVDADGNVIDRHSEKNENKKTETK